MLGVCPWPLRKTLRERERERKRENEREGNIGHKEDRGVGGGEVA